MKHFIITAVLVTTAATMHAEYTSFTFRTKDGKEQTVSADGLKITFADGKLNAKNENGSLSIELADMKSMAFTDFVSGLESVENTAEVSGVYYNTRGVCCGTFETYAEAASTLPAGIYLVRTADGKTIKASIR